METHLLLKLSQKVLKKACLGARGETTTNSYLPQKRIAIGLHYEF